MILTPAILDPRDHVYTLPDKRRACGISEILRTSGYVDDMPPDPFYRERGDRVHLGCHLDNMGCLNDATMYEDEIGYVTAWRKAKKELGIEVVPLFDLGLAPYWEPKAERFCMIASEFAIANVSLGYGTQVDCCFRMARRPGLWCCNVKTGQHWPHYPIQSAGEALCFPDLIGRIGIYLTPEGDYREEVYTSRDDASAFRAAVTIYNDKRKRGLIRYGKRENGDAHHPGRGDGAPAV